MCLSLNTLTMFLVSVFMKNIPSSQNMRYFENFNERDANTNKKFLLEENIYMRKKGRNSD